MVLTLDTSLHGWGAHLHDQVAQGQWSPSDRLHSINFLELKAIQLALCHFQTALEGRHILILMDNTSAKAHVNREGGTRSQSLMFEAELLLNWAERYTLSMKADHISGVANVRADWLSRETIDPVEWQLHPLLFCELSLRFGTPVLDLFTSHKNAQLPRFVSRYPDPLAENYNALPCCHKALLGISPPPSLLSPLRLSPRNPPAVLPRIFRGSIRVALRSCQSHQLAMVVIAVMVLCIQRHSVPVTLETPQWGPNRPHRGPRGDEMRSVGQSFWGPGPTWDGTSQELRTELL